MITILEFKEYFLSGPSWANIQLSDEDVEDLRQSVFNESYDPKQYAASLVKRDPQILLPPPDCSEDNVVYTSVGHTTSENPNSRGYIHLVSQQLCAPVKGTYTAQVTHQSTLSGSVSSKDLPGAQNLGEKLLGKYAKFALGFIKELGLGITKTESDRLAAIKLFT
ncbi:hypothetical protein GTA08_BOTSDO09561 [Botryosphaeria dothidea]|uniref:Uncharacterized protein n=1 Tax=Botryosphaeria dothidea TaxID=55169 RepID=A0A8H4IJI5_9PEZI|nr:hypothetical protein GTA08_BOTSDO09561 [Botryosphaeria dothidea]